MSTAAIRPDRILFCFESKIDQILFFISVLFYKMKNVKTNSNIGNNLLNTLTSEKLEGFVSSNHYTNATNCYYYNNYTLYMNKLPVFSAS